MATLMTGDPAPLCVIAGCGHRATASRGLCTRCYSAAKKTVQNGQASWVELERLGLALPPQMGAFKAAFTAALGKKE